MTTDVRKIIERLDTISSEIKELKQHIIDVDLVLTEDDIYALEKAEKDLDNGKTLRL